LHGKTPALELPISPISLICPLCGAKPNQPCATAKGAELEIVHIARVQAAAKMDAARKKREDFSEAAARNIR